VRVPRGAVRPDEGAAEFLDLGIAHHTSLKALRASKHAGRGGEEDGVAAVADEPSLRRIWDQERDRAIVSRALAVLRDESDVDDRTLTAF
jgi:hypothetical protein